MNRIYERATRVKTHVEGAERAGRIRPSGTRSERVVAPVVLVGLTPAPGA
jgi:hypothetical protein